MLKYSEMDEDLKRKVDRYNEQVPDGLLAMFVSNANVEQQLGVTVIVGGTAFSGTIASERQWVEALAGIPGDGSEALSAAMLDGMAGMEEKPDHSQEEWDAMDEDEQREYHLTWTPSFIHLVDASQFEPSGQIPSRPTPMRFRLSEVQGWYFGKLERGQG